MYQLKLIIASTRPGRKGPAIADWVLNSIKDNPDFETEVLDLAAINLPLLDEPFQPRLKKYQHQHTKDWSAKVEPADAFIIVTSEYNYSFPASLKNALDYLLWEWAYKPVGIVSYGGISGGLRCAEMLKQVLMALSMVPTSAAVPIPAFNQFIGEDGKFTANEKHQAGLEGMMKELARWTTALKTMRS